jgi:hypothetical protein
MRLSETLTEQVFPGLLVTVPASALILHYSGLDTSADATFLAQDRLGAATTSALMIGFFLAISYVAGILLSELGTLCVRTRSNRVVQRQFRERSTHLEERGYFDLREINMGTAPAEAFWTEFQFIRGYVRDRSERAAVRIGGHETLLRVFRPALVAFPIGLTMTGLYIMVAGDDVVGAAMAALSTAFFLPLREAYLLRLETTVDSVIEHFNAVAEREETERG